MEPIPGLDVNALMDVLHDRSEGPVDVRDAKIVSLSKKLRGMTVSMNRQNGNVAMLAEKLTKSQQEIKVMSDCRRIRHSRSVSLNGELISVEK